MNLKDSLSSPREYHKETKDSKDRTWGAIIFRGPRNKEKAAQGLRRSRQVGRGGDEPGEQAPREVGEGLQRTVVPCHTLLVSKTRTES